MSYLLVSNAMTAITQRVDATIAELESTAATALAEHIQLFRAEILASDAATSSDAAKLVCELLAVTLQIGIADGFPQTTIPDDTKRVLQAAKAAGVLSDFTFGSIMLYGDLSGIAQDPFYAADYAAWKRLSDYRKANGRNV